MELDAKNICFLFILRVVIFAVRFCRRSFYPFLPHLAGEAPPEGGGLGRFTTSRVGGRLDPLRTVSDRAPDGRIGG